MKTAQKPQIYLKLKTMKTQKPSTSAFENYLRVVVIFGLFTFFITCVVMIIETQQHLFSLQVNYADDKLMIENTKEKIALLIFFGIISLLMTTMLTLTRKKA